MQDIFTIIRRVTAILCGELYDAAANVTPATPAQRARFGALLEVLSLMRAAMEQASAADAVTPSKRRDIVQALYGGLDQLDTDAGKAGGSKAYATVRVTDYTRTLWKKVYRDDETPDGRNPAFAKRK